MSQIGQKRKESSLLGISDITLDASAHSRVSREPESYSTNPCPKRSRRLGDEVENSNANISRNSSCDTYLPTEILVHIISFLPPTCVNTLPSLAQVSKHHNQVVTQVSESMMHRAQFHFSSFLPKCHPQESSVVSFVRHARFCHDVKEKIDFLKIVDKSEIDAYPSSPLRIDNNCQKLCDKPRSYISLKDVDTALFTILSLFNLLPSFSNNEDSKACNTLAFVTSSLRNGIVKLCGRCSAKIYKYMKLRSMFLEEDCNVNSNGCDQEILSASSSFKHQRRHEKYQKITFPTNRNEDLIFVRSEDTERMNTACFIMILVVNSS